MKAIEKYKELMNESYKLLRIVTDEHAVMQNRLSTLNIDDIDRCRQNLLAYDVAKELEKELINGTFDKAEIQKRMDLVKFLLSEKTDGWAPSFETYYVLDINSFSIDNEKLMRHVSTIRGEQWAREALLVTEEIARLINLQTNNIEVLLSRLKNHFAVPQKNMGSNKKVACFDDIIQYEDKDKLKKRLHFLIDGKSGRNVGYPIRKAWIEKLISGFPTQMQFESEFELLTSQLKTPTTEQERKSAWEAIRKCFDRENTTMDVKASDFTIL